MQSQLNFTLALHCMHCCQACKSGMATTIAAVAETILLGTEQITLYLDESRFSG